MISTRDCILLLADLKNKGLNTDSVTSELLRANEPTINVIKFINSNRELELTKFYTKVRKSYNDKKSKLYINIVKEITDPQEVLTTLSAMLTQVLLFANSLADNEKQMFLKHARAEEISMVLTNYFKTYDITNCIKVLRIIKADIKALEFIQHN